MTALHFSCERGFSECVDKIAKVSTNLNQKTIQFGWTALHIAALSKHDSRTSFVRTQSLDPSKDLIANDTG